MKRIFSLIILFSLGIVSGFSQCDVSISASADIVCTGDNITLTATVGGPDPGNCGQSINMSTTPVTVDCGTSICYYDAGGPSGQYANSSEISQVFTSGNGSPITITFISVNVENSFDEIYVYNGPGQTDLLNTGNLYNTLQGLTFTAQSGIMTVRFSSDGSVPYNGWEAIISCDACSNYTYTWSDGFIGATNAITPNQTTTYTVTATSANCCTATASYTVDVTNCVNTCNDFETVTDRADWTLVNGTQTNQWVMNTGTNNGGSYSLYISNSPTAATPSNAYSTSSTSAVWAYKEFEFPECDDDYVLSFDWKAYGESCCDYIYVYIGDAATVTAGSTTAPVGATALNNPLTSAQKYNLQTGWVHAEFVLDNATYSGSIKTLYFMWRNDGSVGTAPPGAIDNVCLLSCEPCNQPIVTVTPTTAVLCQGESVTLNASATGGAGNYTYTWSPGATLNTTTGNTVVATPTVNTVYQVVVTDGADCSKTVRIPVEIAGTTLTVSSSPAVYCRGVDPVTLTANLNVVGSCSNYTYTWSHGANGAIVTDVPQTNTTYTVTATPVDPGCCVLTATITVDVGDCFNTCSDFETITDRNDWTLVNGTQTTQWVMNTATNNGGAYSIYVSNSPTSVVPPNNYSNTSTNVWAYKEIEFPECDDDYVLSFDWRAYGEDCCDYMYLYIGDLATVTAGSMTAPAGAIQINNPATGVQKFNRSSNWTHAEIILDNATYSGQTKTLYFLWHNDGSVLYDPPAAVDNVCLLSCEPCDQPIVNVTPTLAVLCQGESATFIVTATGGAGGYTYEWDPAGTLNSTTNDTVIASPTATTTYRVRVTDALGCSKSVRVTAEIAGTTLSVSADPPGFCIGMEEPVTVTATLNVDGSCSNYLYTWNTGATTSTITANPTMSTTYTVTATPTDPSCCELIASTTVAVMECSADGCPSVAPADLITGSTNIELDCITQTEITLSANVMATAIEADDYFVFPITYAPPFGFTDGTRIFDDATDDTWGDIVNLPFTFCYYGNTYTQIVPGANAVATFNTAVATQYCSWSFDESIPDVALFPNTIFACYRDIYPSIGDYNSVTGDGGIFEGVLGEYPCRTYVLSFNNIKLFSCTEIRTFSSMIVLYEGTNIIDIYIRDAPTCTSWNDGNGLIGLQNSDGTAGITPPGRNTGPWTAHQEAWRFMPTGQPSYQVTWYAGVDTTAAPIGHGDLLTIYPTVTSDYTARLQYTACNGDYFDIINTCRIAVNNETPDLSITATLDTLCPNTETTLTAVTDEAVSYLWSTGDTVPSITVRPPGGVTNYSVVVVYENGCEKTADIDIFAIATVPPPTFTGVREICAGETLTIQASDHFAYIWNNGSTNSSITVSPQVTTTYSLTISDEIGCQASDSVTVVVHPTPIAGFAPAQFLTFLEDGQAPVDFIDLSQNTEFWDWNFGDPTSGSNNSSDPEPTHIYTQSGIYTVLQTVSTAFGCIDSITHPVSIQKPFYFYVPSAFTPDGDGINEVFIPLGEGVDLENYEFQIFDRFGRMIFSTNSLYQGWDGKEKGKELPLGVYVYVIKTQTMDKIPKEFIGTVTLVR